MEANIAPKSQKCPLVDVWDATFCENGRPSPNTARHGPNACPAPPESSIFAPFGPNSRPKALLERCLKNVSNKNAKKSPTVTKMETQQGGGFAQFCYFWAPKRHPGARGCPEVPRTPQNLHFGTNNHQKIVQHAKNFINTSAYFGRFGCRNLGRAQGVAFSSKST